MKLYAGTSGFSYKEWKGPFYPEKLPAHEMLEFYASRLPTVEINNTFYRMPKREMLAGWSDKVPQTFRFAVKAPRRISHAKQLKDCGEELAHLCRALEALGEKLCAVLVQLPPHARAEAGNLDAFLTLVPPGFPMAFEFRHASWRDESVYELLDRHQAAWVTADSDGDEPPDLPETASWTYLRLRASSYTDEQLRAWRTRCRHFERAYAYFKHEEQGAAPALAQRFMGT